jgi:IS5 family transposase
VEEPIGKEGMELLLKETVDVALLENCILKSEMRHVDIDTTVQEKNIAFPTDSSLLYKAILKLGKAALDRDIPLRQSYKRVAKKAHHKAGRYAHARQFKRMKGQIRFLRTRLGRLIRDIDGKAPVLDDSLQSLLALCKRLHEQKRGDVNKIYSLHEPEVQCISKGKAHKRYEFGCKVAVATSNRGDWFLAAESLTGNPYDGHTLAMTIEAVERVTGVEVNHAYVDKGYRGHDYKGKGEVHIPGRASRKASWSIRKRRRRRSAIEPKIGHAKSENRMGRCFLKGLAGDAINAILAVAGANIRKLLSGFHFLPMFFSWLKTEFIRLIISLWNFRDEFSVSRIAYRGLSI